VDLNGDGRNDILSGSYSRKDKSMAGLFQVLWGSGDGFKKATALHGSDGAPLIIPADDKKEMTKKICTRPSAVDWDGDGDLDLVVGNFEGSFYLFRGEGGGRFPPEPEVMQCEGRDLRVSGAHSDPFPVDWDGDGDLDLLSGSAQGGVEWAENKAGRGREPKLTHFQRLIAAPDDGVATRDRPSDSTRVWVEDVNGDGKLDILTGDNAIINHPAKGVSEEDMLRKKAAWEKELQAMLDKMNEKPVGEDGRPDTKLMQKYRDHYQTRSRFMTDERTGFVWLYVQK